MKRITKKTLAVLVLMLVIVAAVAGVMIHKRTEARRLNEAEQGVELEVPDDSSGDSAAEPASSDNAQTTDTENGSDGETDPDSENNNTDSGSSEDSEEYMLPEISID